MNFLDTPPVHAETSQTEAEIIQETKTSLGKLGAAIKAYSEKGGFAGLIAAIKVFLGVAEEETDPEVIEEAEEMVETSICLDVSNGRVDPNQLRQYLTIEISRTRLNGFVPADGAMYGINTGSPTEWAKFMTALAKKESSYRIACVGDVGVYEGNSNGLYQLSPNDATNHRLQSTPFSQDQLTDPVQNTNAAIAILERLVLRDGVIAQRIDNTPGASRTNPGASAYWGPLRRGWTPTEEGV